MENKMFTFPKFHRVYPNQGPSGLIPPNNAPWPDRDTAAVNKPIWKDPELKPEPAPPTRDEKLTAARTEAVTYLQDQDTENVHLITILMIRHGISLQDARQAVREAQAEIERGAKEDV
jgi:hypothetical protein